MGVKYYTVAGYGISFSFNDPSSTITLNTVDNGTATGVLQFNRVTSTATFLIGADSCWLDGYRGGYKYT